MKKLKSTVGLVGGEGVTLKDHSVFENGDMVIVIAAESLEEFFDQINDFKNNLEKSKKWMEEIKGMKENNFD
ncbi:MAG: hypothetical protein ACXVH2_05045 [Methanobacterium sp.]